MSYSTEAGHFDASPSHEGGTLSSRENSCRMPELERSLFQSTEHRPQQNVRDRNPTIGELARRPITAIEPMDAEHARAVRSDNSPFLVSAEIGLNVDFPAVDLKFASVALQYEIGRSDFGVRFCAPVPTAGTRGGVGISVAAFSVQKGSLPNAYHVDVVEAEVGGWAGYGIAAEIKASRSLSLNRTAKFENNLSFGARIGIGMAGGLSVNSCLTVNVSEMLRRSRLHKYSN